MAADSVQDFLQNIVGTEQDKTICPFFLKTGCCQYADRCKRAHLVPMSSKVVLFRHMCWSLVPETLDEEDDDAFLQDDAEMDPKFDTFFEDMMPELESFGKVLQFKACRNFAHHLRGNVYVQFETEEQAAQCVQRMNGRWYASKQIGCELTVVRSWRAAMCGPADRKYGCPRRRNCNFLHCFRNPRGNFRDADRDVFPGQVAGPVQPTDRDRDRSSRGDRERVDRGRERDVDKGRDADKGRDNDRGRDVDKSRRERSRSPARRDRDRERDRERDRARGRGRSSPVRSSRDSSRRRRSRSRSRSPGASSRRHRSRSRSRSPQKRTEASRRRSGSQSRSPPKERTEVVTDSVRGHESPSHTPDREDKASSPRASEEKRAEAKSMSRSPSPAPAAAES